METQRIDNEKNRNEANYFQRSAYRLNIGNFPNDLICFKLRSIDVLSHYYSSFDDKNFPNGNRKQTLFIR